MGLKELSFGPFFICSMAKRKDVIPSIDELNLITAYIYQSRNKEVEGIMEDILSLLIEAYLLGFRDTEEAENEKVDTEKLDQAVNKKIAGETVRDRIRTHVENEDLPALQRVLATEYHRDYNQGALDGAQVQQTRQGGKKYTTKTWMTMLDDRVRDTHEFLEGVTIPINEEFYTNDGDHAMIPGGFENPDNNINCRCILRFA